MRLSLLGALLTTWASCATSSSVLSDEIVAQANQQEKAIFKLDETGFVQELIFARATPRTPQFDDYTPGSYHVDKLSLLYALRSRRAAGDPLLGFFVVGPSGPLWRYDVVVFLREGAAIRVNTVSFAHARLVVKSTKLIDSAEFHLLFALIQGSGATVVDEPVRWPGKNARGLPFEWTYDFLAADWSGHAEAILYAPQSFLYASDPPSQALCLWEALDSVFDGAFLTYSSDISDSESVYRPPKAP